MAIVATPRLTAMLCAGICYIVVSSPSASMRTAPAKAVVRVGVVCGGVVLAV